MKRSLPCVLILVLASCSRAPETADGPLTRELLQRHIVDRGPVRYRTVNDYCWTAEEVESIIDETSTSATVKVRESGYREPKEQVKLSPRIERKLDREARKSGMGKHTREMLKTRRVQYGDTTRTATYEFSRNSIDDFWRVDHCNLTLKLKTGPYGEPVEPEKVAQSAEQNTLSSNEPKIHEPQKNASTSEQTHITAETSENRTVFPKKNFSDTFRRATKAWSYNT